MSGDILLESSSILANPSKSKETVTGWGIVLLENSSEDCCCNSCCQVNEDVTQSSPIGIAEFNRRR